MTEIGPGRSERGPENRPGGARTEAEAAADAEADALARDAADPLTSMRDRFLLPTAADGTPAIYLAGQSLGL
ncbi:MAG TPA: hypothetical protein VIL81_06515, partial [Candidatus Limnocylindrales bacterium]